MDERNRVFVLALTAVLSAIAFVATAFLAIPYPGGGYFNFGDAAIILSSAFLGPLPSLFVAFFGGAMADIFLGMAMYAPFSLLAKFLLSLSSSLFFRLFKRKWGGLLLGSALGGILEVLSYMLCYYLLLGTLTVSSLFDLIQAAISIAVSIPLYLAINRAVAFRLHRKA